MLGGCTSIDSMMEQLPYVEIPWTAFLTEADRLSLEEVEADPIALVPLELDMEKDQTHLAFWKESADSLSSFVTDKSVYMDALIDQEPFNQFVEGTVQREGHSLLADGLLEAMGETYKEPHQAIQSLTLTALERSVSDVGQVTTAEWSLVTVGDEELFTVFPILISLNSDDQIVDVSVGKSKELQNTIRPLSSDAYFEEDTYLIIEDMVSHTAKVIKENWDGSDLAKTMKQIKESTANNELSVTDETEQGIKAWSEHVQGMGNSALTKVRHTDAHAKAESLYTLSVSNAEEVMELTLTVDRTTNTIVSINREDIQHDKTEDID